MEIPKEIKEAITSNRLVVFAGSGLSIKFNLPNWSKLVADVINESSIDKYKILLPVLESGLISPLEILEIIKPEHYAIEKYIKKNFNIKNADFSLHKKILELTGQIITTNYDNAFEEASNNSIIPSIYTSKLNISEINKTNSPYIFKLHGSFSESDNCIIFKEDYANLYSEETAAKEKLKSIFAEKTILFIGFSFNDPDINLIFSKLDSAFGNNNKHFILTNEDLRLKKHRFLESLLISEFNEIDLFIDLCLKYKRENNRISLIEDYKEKTNDKIIPKIALLFPNPIDLDFKDEISKVINCFDTLDANLFLGTLNIRTLLTIEEYDILIIVSKVFKSNLYIEDDNLKSNLISPEEICSNIPNENIPIVFITNEKIESVPCHPTIYISTFKNAIINKFIYKALKKADLVFKEDELSIHLQKLFNGNVISGQTKTNSIYNNNKNLDIGKKCLSNVIGRIEEQSAIALKLISIKKSNKLLNIKASGGTGKTTLIKKVAYELYNRGYYKDGVSFKSCESVKAFIDFEELLIDGFNLTNILNFKEYLIENHNNKKIDILIILDNFETVVNALSTEEFLDVIELLKFATDYGNIVVTSREKLSLSDDFEDVYSLTQLITDDALTLFQKYYGPVQDERELKVLREGILEDLLNNNPLAIKLVTKSRPRLAHISEFKDQIKEHFFESINEDYTLVFKNNADLNIERTRSIYQSINYSYSTLNQKEKIAFELLSLFPDGISLSNFKKCFEKSTSTNNISDRELRVIRNKSLVEDYNGNLQLQPIIRRFADYQFSKRSKETKQGYCLDAYLFNVFVLELIQFIENKASISEALKIFSHYRNNMLNVFSYIPDIQLKENGPVPEKKLLLNFIYLVQAYIINEKQINEFHNKLYQLRSYFSDLPNAEIFIMVLDLNKIYYYQEFDNSYRQLSLILSVQDLEKRVFKDEDYLEKRYKNIISNIHSMEGYTIQRIKSFISNDDVSNYLDAHFFYLGIINNISRNKDGFYYFEYELMFNKLDIIKLEKYIESLYLEERLEIMQSTYTLSKVKMLEWKTIQRLVVTNPYTKGLKELMFAFISKSDNEKIKHFEEALSNLSHIKYYYLEALYYYCLFLKGTNVIDYNIKLSDGLNLSKKFHYQYLNFLFNNIEKSSKEPYNFTYSYYPLSNLEDFVVKHNVNWEKEFKDNQIDR